MRLELFDEAICSATWASDTDISRLLKSLPSWSVLCPTTPSSTPSIPQPPPPSTPSALSAAQLANGLQVRSRQWSFEYQPTHLQETEQTVRQRTQRESEILISNFGVQNEIERRALITDVQHARAIACAHESLQWFCGQMRALIEAIPPHAQSHLKRAVEITSPDGKKVEQVGDELLDSTDSIRSLCRCYVMPLNRDLQLWRPSPKLVCS